MPPEVGIIAAHVVTKKRSTFSRAIGLSEVLRQIHAVRSLPLNDLMANGQRRKS